MVPLHFDCWWRNEHHNRIWIWLSISLFSTLSRFSPVVPFTLFGISCSIAVAVIFHLQISSCIQYELAHFCILLVFAYWRYGEVFFMLIWLLLFLLFAVIVQSEKFGSSELHIILCNYLLLQSLMILLNLFMHTVLCCCHLVWRIIMCDQCVRNSRRSYVAW
jgi:hypothetical protein